MTNLTGIIGPSVCIKQNEFQVFSYTCVKANDMIFFLPNLTRHVKVIHTVMVEECDKLILALYWENSHKKSIFQQSSITKI